jgi:hypothetical protein
MPAINRAPPSRRSRAIETLRRPVCGSGRDIGSRLTLEPRGHRKKPRKIDIRAMHNVLHGPLLRHHRRERTAQCGQAKAMQLVACNAERACKARPRVEQVPYHRHRPIADPFKKLGRSMFAERQDRRDLEPGIDGTGYPMQISGCLEGGQKAAHALVVHGRSQSLPQPLIAAAAGNA